jgi:hypothetical protein
VGSSAEHRRFSCQRCGLTLVMVSRHGRVTFSFDMLDWESSCLDSKAPSPLACRVLGSPMASKDKPHH